MRTLAERLIDLVNRTGHVNGMPFDAATPMPPPSGRVRNWVHYGVMVPDLPEPHRSFGVMSILGTPGVTIFANDHAILTDPSDTAYTSSATASMRGGQFLVHSISRDCDFAADGSHLRFGSELEIDGRYPHFAVRRSHPDVTVELTIDATDKVAHFANIPGLYRHWSLLASYRGHVDHNDERVEVEGLCTVEYACGVGTHSVSSSTWPKLPAKFFTYHVLNLDHTTQALLVVVLGPSGLPVQRAVYLRSLDDYGAVYTRGLKFDVQAYEAQPRETPDGRAMRLPQQLAWRVLDDDGHDLLAVEGQAGGDYSYGLGAGYVGTYDYTAIYRGRELSGRAYIEYIDCR
ncbi:DUF6670 family protein [Antrihabitans cavernicola]|uniref:Uncharacterized protein n=1 Tax=Antrihabitans cavernicola TaxID=2495913 RepID=A0A5A7S7B0_9NOCA|nr:DUF6670 family protein [Spelaeibacter cavernicola]KAA0018448.1 hypothetical protein FOY51_23470 [Spelaeibacter cavernicola]